MSNGRGTILAAFLLGWGCLLTSGLPAASAQGKQQGGKSEVVFSKADKLTADDEKDTNAETRNSHRKSYKVKLSEGQVYRIDLTSPDFDTYLRLENPAGKQVAFNDDVDTPNKILDSRILYAAPKTGEYRIIVTTFEPAKTGAFNLEIKTLTGAEAEQARAQARIDAFPDASPAEQKKIITEFAKDLTAKGGDKLTIKDAQTAIQLAMSIDESEAAMTREACQSFGKIFEGASNKQLAVVGKILDQQVVRNLDKIGKDIEITGKTTDGKEFNLKDLKGKVVLVDFWATWCPPCVAEIPNIIEAHKKYNGKGFEIIGVSLDRSNDDITKFVEAKKVPWKSINIEDSKKLADKYGVNAIPHPILVGRDGRIVSLRARGPQLERLLDRLMSEKK
jgi:thiol-disulfide isomerase/thioredoxin